MVIDEFRAHKKLYVKWISNQMGWGVFTDEPILSGETIETCYCLIDGIQTAPHQDYIFRVTPDSGYVYHALGYGAIYNHSDSSNIIWRTIDIKRQIIRFYAKRDILAGEELRWNYGKNYWRDRENKKKLI